MTEKAVVRGIKGKRKLNSKEQCKEIQKKIENKNKQKQAYFIFILLIFFFFLSLCRYYILTEHDLLLFVGRQQRHEIRGYIHNPNSEHLSSLSSLLSRTQELPSFMAEQQPTDAAGIGGNVKKGNNNKQTLKGESGQTCSYERDAKKVYCIV